MTGQLQHLERGLRGQLSIRGQCGHRMRLTDLTDFGNRGKKYSPQRGARVAGVDDGFLVRRLPSFGRMTAGAGTAVAHQAPDGTAVSQGAGVRVRW